MCLGFVALFALALQSRGNPRETCDESGGVHRRPRTDVVLGFDSLTPYQDGTSPYFGAIVGRVANRIAGAAFQLGGKRYSVTPNERGNCLHGGARGFDKRWWKAEPLQTPEGEALRLTYTSLNGALAAASVPLAPTSCVSAVAHAGVSCGGCGQARKGSPAT